MYAANAPSAMLPPDPIAQYGSNLLMPSVALIPNALPCVTRISSESGISATPSLISRLASCILSFTQFRFLGIMSNALVKFYLLCGGIVLLCTQDLSAQKLKPGFDQDEFIEMVKVYSRQGDSSWFYVIPDPIDYKMVYRSPIVGLDNRYDLWISENNIAVLSIRGTTSLPISWLQ